VNAIVVSLAAGSRTSAVPHFEQKLAVSGFWNPHSGQ